MNSKDLKGLSEAYNEVYSDEYHTQVEEYTKDIFLVLSESLIQQGYSAVDVLEYFNEVDEDSILEDFISLIDGDILTESVASEYYIQEQYDILAEGIASAIGKVLAKGAQKVGGKILTGLKSTINPQAISAVKNAPKAASLVRKVGTAAIKGAKYPTSAIPSGLTGRIGNAIGGPRVASALSAGKKSLERSIQQGGGSLKSAIKSSPAMGGQLVNRMKSAASNVKNVASSALSKVKGNLAAANTASKAAGGGVKSVLGKVAGPVMGGVIDTADEKSKGSGWGRSLAKGVTTAVGTALGAAAGTAAAPGAGTLAGGLAGQYAAGKAFDMAAGANAKERAQMATSNRQSQAGSKIVGSGGPMAVNKAKNAITTGVGPNRKTVKLSNTQAIPQGKGQEIGYLAYKGGKPVYKRAADPSTLSKTSSNPFERIGRTINPNAYKASDAAAKSAKLKTAQANTATYKKNLGIKEDFEYWVDSLFEEGYDLSNYTWEGLFEYFCDEVLSEATRPGVNQAANYLRPSVDSNPNADPYAGKPNPPKRSDPLFGNPSPPASPQASTTTSTKPAQTILASRGGVQGTMTKGDPSSWKAKEGGYSSSEMQRIRSVGTKRYETQRKAAVSSGKPEDFKSTTQTGLEVWSMANPKLAKANADRVLTRGTPFTSNSAARSLMKYPEGVATTGPEVPKTGLDPITGYAPLPSSKGQGGTSAPAPATAATNQIPSTSPRISTTSGSSSSNMRNNRAMGSSKPGSMFGDSFDFSSPSKVASDMAYLYQSIYEGKKKVDQDVDGDNDFADVMIARMVAAGVPKAEAIRRVRNKEYNK